MHVLLAAVVLGGEGLASHVLPTPADPQKRKEVTGQPGSRRPELMRRTMDLMALGCPLTQKARESSRARSVKDSAEVSLSTGVLDRWEMPVGDTELK